MSVQASESQPTLKSKIKTAIGQGAHALVKKQAMDLLNLCAKRARMALELSQPEVVAEWIRTTQASLEGVTPAAVRFLQNAQPSIDSFVADPSASFAIATAVGAVGAIGGAAVLLRRAHKRRRDGSKIKLDEEQRSDSVINSNGAEGHPEEAESATDPAAVDSKAEDIGHYDAGEDWMEHDEDAYQEDEDAQQEDRDEDEEIRAVQKEEDNATEGSVSDQVQEEEDSIEGELAEEELVHKSIDEHLTQQTEGSPSDQTQEFVPRNEDEHSDFVSLKQQSNGSMELKAASALTGLRKAGEREAGASNPPLRQSSLKESAPSSSSVGGGTPMNQKATIQSDDESNCSSDDDGSMDVEPNKTGDNEATPRDMSKKKEKKEKLRQASDDREAENDCVIFPRRFLRPVADGCEQVVPAQDALKPRSLSENPHKDAKTTTSKKAEPQITLRASSKSAKSSSSANPERLGRHSRSSSKRNTTNLNQQMVQVSRGVFRRVSDDTPSPTKKSSRAAEPKFKVRKDQNVERTNDAQYASTAVQSQSTTTEGVGTAPAPQRTGESAPPKETPSTATPKAKRSLPKRTVIDLTED